MGLVDDVRCQYPLPDEEAQDELFQTKSFGQTHARYTITEEGRFVRHYLYYKRGQEETAHEWDVDLNWHGPVHFYGGDSDQWYDYYAYFEDGTVQWIKRKEEVPEKVIYSGVR